MNAELVVQSLVGLLEETYEGGKSSFFTDGTGVLKTLEGLSPVQASKPLFSDGLTIAAHAEHLRWSLTNLNNTVRGAAWNPDWSSSWLVRGVSEVEWQKLRSNLQSEYQTFHHTMSTSNMWWSDPMMFGGVIATIAHAAYHLGAIRAMLKGL